MNAEYAELLTQALPSVIHIEKENERLISILEELERRSNNWTLAETKLAELLTLLIEQFEDENYQLKAADPEDVLRELMEANHLKHKDLVDIFGTESAVSAVLSGKQEMTKEQMKRLSKRFKVSPEVFF